MEEQSSAQDVSSLPTLHVSDIDRQGVEYPSDKRTWTRSGATALKFIQQQPTNGVNYFRGTVNLTDLPADLLPTSSLFAQLLCK